MQPSGDGEMFVGQREFTIARRIRDPRNATAFRNTPQVFAFEATVELVTQVFDALTKTCHSDAAAKPVVAARSHIDPQ